MRLASLLLPLLAVLCGNAAANVGGDGEKNLNLHSRAAASQTLVTYDSQSFMVRGERIMIYSGDFHPFRLPVPGLWLDIFQKIKALGFNAVSFYTFWGLLEGTEGVIVDSGIFALTPFFQAATQAGIYLIARPGPYINAEVSAGGYPGWVLRINSTLRSYSPDYLDATKRYVTAVGKQLATAQITNGGPVIMLQVENEYSSWPGENSTSFPSTEQREYMAYVQQQWRDLGLVVPFFTNDPSQSGYWAPGSGVGEVELYNIDAYPLGFGCVNPYNWSASSLTTTWPEFHQLTAPNTPFGIAEFTGGAATAWTSLPEQDCIDKINDEAVRILFKNNYAAGVKSLNVYMIWGGTNWGNLGYSGGDTSYDVAAAIAEDRTLIREKYYENKLQANFIKVSPAYLLATPRNQTAGGFTNNSDITTTASVSTVNGTVFYIIRHTDYSSWATTFYRLQILTSVGSLNIPYLGGNLSLIGRDSKVTVTDYDLGGVNLVYSTADVFTWAGPNSVGKRVLVLYGGLNQTHEFAIPSTLGIPAPGENTQIKTGEFGNTTVVQWNVAVGGQTVTIGDLIVYLLWRNDAYNYWTAELPAASPVYNFSLPSKSYVIAKAGYLLRSASISGTSIRLVGDINATTDIAVVYEPTGAATSLTYNDVLLTSTITPGGALTATVAYQAPSYTLPDFSTLQWKMIDNLPEIQNTYDDSAWTVCNYNTSTNPIVSVTTPTSLFASDYGYHSGSLIYRGHFTANGLETNLTLVTAGGIAFGHSVWLNGSFIGSWTGSAINETYFQTLPVTSLQTGQPYVFTVVVDHMGLDEETPGTDIVKSPRGILAYYLTGHISQSDVTWKLTGNFGGENYHDKDRGPRNEGATYAERHGFHMPSPPSRKWSVSSPINNGLAAAGMAFYTTSFQLSIPAEYDVPLAFAFENVTSSQNYRVQMFVNGYNFGRYVSNLQRPDAVYPVPEGILNYAGTNTVAIALWALDASGATVGEITLVPGLTTLRGYQRPALAPQHAWRVRPRAY